MLSEEQIQIAAKSSSAASYVFSGGTFLGAAMNFLNANGIAIGAICAILTLVVNTYFQHKRMKYMIEKEKEDA